ncbi:hypothetical protein GOV14_03340 [Candidatus Pacearchaeota archaeon]|nr:hypothetical protein [Candidatus Pacearchaeota archaeon]
MVAIKKDIIPKGTIFLRRVKFEQNSYVIPLEDIEVGEKGSAEHFYLTMDAFGSGLPGYEYTEMGVFAITEDRLVKGNESLKRLNDSELEKLTDDRHGLIKASSKIISEHGKEWLTQEYWKGTGYWD